MLTIEISPKEAYNDKTEEFVKIDGCTLNLEHSLVSISKWETKRHKPFLSDQQKTNEELIDYIRCMTITQNVNPLIYKTLTVEEVKKINEYIGDIATATTFNNRRKEGASRKKEIVTSELIYYWLVAYQIPFECQRWHLNRLLTLIRICGIKNDTSKNSKMSRKATLASNAKLNAARKQSLNTKG